MAKGSTHQSIRAYLREQEKAINSEVRNQMKSNSGAVGGTNYGGSNRPSIRHH